MLSSRTIKYHLTSSDFSGKLDYAYAISKDEVSELTVLVLRIDEPRTEKGNPLPRYRMTRKITIKEVNIEGVQHLVIKCSCMHFLRFKCPCRHFYCITNEQPDIAHFSPERTLAYEQFYGEEGMEEYTSKCEKMIGIFNCRGGLVLLNITLRNFKKQMKTPQGDIASYNKSLTELGIDMTPRDKNMAAQLAKYKYTDTKNARKKQTPREYAREATLACYRECLTVTKTDKDIEIINDALIEARGKIMRNNSKGNIDISKGTVQDLPATESREKENRIAPPGSPGRRKNNH